jgi:hypothetical protein
MRFKIMAVDDFLRPSTELIVLAIIITVLVGCKTWVLNKRRIRVAFLVCISSSNPWTQLSTNSHKSRVIDIGKLRHIHMVAVDSDWDVTGQDGGILWHNRVLRHQYLGKAMALADLLNQIQAQVAPRRSKRPQSAAVLPDFAP